MIKGTVLYLAKGGSDRITSSFVTTRTNLFSRLCLTLVGGAVESVQVSFPLAKTQNVLICKEITNGGTVSLFSEAKSKSLQSIFFIFAILSSLGVMILSILVFCVFLNMIGLNRSFFLNRPEIC